MKNRFAIIIFIFINVLLMGSLFLYSINTVKASDSQVIGDVNSDGKVGSTDYILIRKYILKAITLTDNQKKLADVNSDNKISSLDYIKIKQIVINSGKIEETSTPKPTPSPTPKPTASSVIADSNYIEAYFLNTYNKSTYKESHTTNNAFIFKTSNNKYVLLDTGIKANDIKKNIYNELKGLQGKNKVTIDYMIISHMHGDHYGNAINIINDSNITIKKLILKREKTSSIDEKIVDAAKEKNISIIETDNVKEGYSIKLSNQVNMYFFNVKDVYKDDTCKKTDYITRFASGTGSNDYARTPDGMYIYISGSEYLNSGNKIKIYTGSKLEPQLGETGDKINGRFYLSLGTIKKRNVCSSNANSIAIIFQVKTANGNKYIYAPGDIENNGYNPLGEYDSNLKTTIHGYSPTYYYKYELIDGEPRFYVKDYQLVKSTKTPSVKKASAYITAVTIKNTFADIIGNLTVYQMAHHGLNNYKEVSDVLKLNDSSVYTIVPNGSNIKKSNAFQQADSVYNFKNTKMYYGGQNKKNGVKCIINNIGTTTCDIY